MSILNHFFDYKPEVLALDEKAMELLKVFDLDNEASYLSSNLPY